MVVEKISCRVGEFAVRGGSCRFGALAVKGGLGLPVADWFVGWFTNAVASAVSYTAIFVEVDPGFITKICFFMRQR